MPVILSVKFAGVQGIQPLGIEMYAMSDKDTLVDATEWNISPSKCLNDRIVVQATSTRSWSSIFDYDGLADVTYVPIIARTSQGISISNAARSLSTQVSSEDGAKVIFTLPDVSLEDASDVDWFCIGIYTRLKNNSWFFKEVHSFPDHSGDVPIQLRDLLASVDEELQRSSLDDSYFTLPPATIFSKPKVLSPTKSLNPSPRAAPSSYSARSPTEPEAQVSIASVDSDDEQADFLVSHHREVATLQARLAAAENELRLTKSKTHVKMVHQAVGDSRPLVTMSCSDCDRHQREARSAKDRLVELEAALVLQDLVGDKTADKLITAEENRSLSLRCAELEGKCAVQAKLIEDLNRTKKQLIASITALPRMNFTSDVHDVGNDGDDPIVHHIRVQERVLASLRLQLDQLSTQISLATAMKN